MKVETLKKIEIYQKNEITEHVLYGMPEVSSITAGVVALSLGLGMTIKLVFG